MSVGAFQAGFSLYLDGVSLVMMFIITGIGFLILTLTAGKLPEVPAAIVGAGSIGLSFLVALLAGMEFMASEAESFSQNLWTWMFRPHF